MFVSKFLSSEPTEPLFLVRLVVQACKLYGSSTLFLSIMAISRCGGASSRDEVCGGTNSGAPVLRGEEEVVFGFKRWSCSLGLIWGGF